MEDLGGVLEEFDAWFFAERPDLYASLRPGLSEREIRDLEARLDPYLLPEELISLYRWHDGWEPLRGGRHVDLHHDCTFPPLEETLDRYEMSCGLNREIDDIWNPLWFPAFGDQSGELVELAFERGLPGGHLWSFHSHGAELCTTFDSVTSLFRTTLELWRVGLLPVTQDRWQELRARVASYNPAARHADGASRLERSRFPSVDWPEAWLIAAGLERPRAADDADVITIAELLADPQRQAPVRGEFRCAMASAEGWDAGTLTDETGSTRVLLERRSTQNYRWHLASNRFEMTLTPMSSEEPIEHTIARGEFESDLEESITQGLLEASSASFHAIRIVPLMQGAV